MSPLPPGRRALFGCPECGAVACGDRRVAWLCILCATAGRVVAMLLLPDPVRPEPLQSEPRS